MLETRDITVNGAVRTAFHESIFTVSIAPGNVRIVRLLFGDEALNVQLEGACPDYGDIQEISGSPAGRGTYREQWDGFRNYLVLVQPANLEPGCLKAWGGIAKMKSGLEIKVLYWFTALDGVEDSLIGLDRAKKQCIDFFMKRNLKDEEARKESERKEAEDRALALKREKAAIALLQAQAQAIKQPAAAPEARKPIEPRNKPTVTFSEEFKTVTCSTWPKSESRDRGRVANVIIQRLFENWRYNHNRPIPVEELLKGQTIDRLDKALNATKYPKAWKLIVIHAEETGEKKTAMLSDTYDYRAS